MNIFEFFGLKNNPFLEQIQPEDVLMDGRLKPIITELNALPEVGNLGILTGRTGVGKTILLQVLIKKWRVTNDVYYLHLGNLHSMGLMRSILTIIGEQPRLSKDRIIKQFYEHLARNQRPLCLIIDEAQLMTTQTITDLRILCGHPEYGDRLIMILSGQPSLSQIIQADSLTDFRERINIECHLSSMTSAETFAYVEHRIKKAGGQKDLFDDDAIKMLYHHSEGIPRRINQTAIKAMLNAQSAGIKNIDTTILREACAADRS